MKTLITFLLFINLAACSESPLGGQSDRKALFVGTNKPKDCDTFMAQTQAKLLTDVIVNTRDRQDVKYELTLVNCEGDFIDLNDSPILFDINAFLSAENSQEVSSLPYSIENEKNEIIMDGSLDLIRGQDLFGVTDSNRFHWKTARITQEISLKKVFFTFVLSGYELKTMNQSEDRISTFLKVGQTQALQKDIRFSTR